MELKLKLSNKVFPTPQKNALKGKKFNFNILYTEMFSNCKLGTIQKLHIPLRGRGRSPKDYKRLQGGGRFTERIHWIQVIEHDGF